MTAQVIPIHSLYLARAQILRWRMKVARRAGRRDDANEFALLAWDAEKLACRIRAQSNLGMVNGGVS